MSEEIIQLENRCEKYEDRHTKENNEKIINSPQVKEGIKMKIKKYLERKDKKCKIIKACKTQQKPS